MIRLGSLGRLNKRLAACSFRSGAYTILDRLLSSRIGFLFPGSRKMVTIKMRRYAKPFYIRLGTTDWMVLEELFIAREYDPIRDAVREPVRIILDLGTNVGFSVRLWHEMFPDAMIVGVEPDENNLRICAANTRHFSGQFTAVHSFVGAVSSMATIDRSGGGDWALRMAEKSDSDANGTEIRVLTVPQILEHAGWREDIDLLKCDIEGAESMVFSECQSWIQRVKNILIELHGSLTAAAFQDTLRRNGGSFTMSIWEEGEGYAVVHFKRESTV